MGYMSTLFARPFQGFGFCIANMTDGGEK